MYIISAVNNIFFLPPSFRKFGKNQDYESNSISADQGDRPVYHRT